MTKAQSKSIRIVEVGLRDGLQNEKFFLTTGQRVEMAARLLDCGVQNMELGAFVRADRVPQMAGSSEVVTKIFSKYKNHKIFSVLVPNIHGFEQAKKLKVKEIAIFASATEGFSQKNINCSIAESLERYKEVCTAAKKEKIKVRGYLSCTLGCPYEGKVDEKKVVNLALALIKMGCYEVSIGDTIGIAQPGQIKSLFKKLLKVIPANKLAGHFHDTRGLALTNILTAYQMGIRVFDSSLGGLGGCPYAPGSAGNVATEEVVMMFEGLGINTQLDLKKLLETCVWLTKEIERPLTSRLARAGLPSSAFDLL